MPEERLKSWIVDYACIYPRIGRVVMEDENLVHIQYAEDQSYPY